jgi:predicted esterase
MLTGSVATFVHGRYLYEDRGGDRLLVGFHGYAEAADANLAELLRIPRSERWSLLSVQALHPFYTRSGEVVASWMTKVDRELAIGDNIAYVQKVLAQVPRRDKLVFSGFSQGAAMAARAAANIACSGLVMLGGDVPADAKKDRMRLPPALLGRGIRDEWYTDEKFKADLEYLEPRTRVTRCVFAGGHEWSDAFREAFSEFLASLR